MGTTEIDVLVIGGGLAGLGVATTLGKEFGLKVTVLDKCKPKLDGNDRFNPAMAASFKTAGMFDLGTMAPGVRQYFAGKTGELFGELGVDLRDKGAYVVAPSMLNNLAADALLERVDPKTLEEELEPNVKLVSPNEAVLKFAKGSQADPEATMKILIEKAREDENVEVIYGNGATDLYYNGIGWSVTAESGKKYKAKKLVVAAGPTSAALLRRVDYNLPMQKVYAVVSQSEELKEPWLQGSILGAKSYMYWFLRSACQCFYEGNPLQTTSLFGESSSWTTHMYMNVHNNRIYLGGPRIALPTKYDEDATKPSTYFRDIAETEAYSRELIQFPKGTAFEERNRWGGVMAYPKDADYPFVGPVGTEFSNSLYVCTGFASAGFKEAYGAGHFLACLMLDGEQKLRQRIGSVNGHDFDKVIPLRRAKRLSH